MAEKSRRSVETLGLLGADNWGSLWHFHKHFMVLFH